MGGRQSEMATELEVNLAGDYEQLGAGRTSDVESTCFEFGDTTHFRGIA